MSRRNVIYIRVLLVIVSIVVLLAFLNRTPQQLRHDTWLPSSFNPVGAGNMAFYQTLLEMNWPVERWREPLSRLSAYGTGNVLIVTRSSIRARVAFTEQEIELLETWVGKGNTLILLGALADGEDTRKLLQQIGFNLPVRPDLGPDIFHLLQPKPDTAVTIPAAPGLPQKSVLVLPRVPPLPSSFPTGAKVLWADHGQAWIVDVPVGSGHVICGASADLLDNRWLPRGDNLAIVLGLLAPSGHVPKYLFFEESHHGFSAIYAISGLFSDQGLRFAAMLALLGGLTFFGSSLVRFGPIVPLQPETGRSTLEFVDSIADLYLRADLRNDTLKSIFDETHQRVLLRLHLPPTASHELIGSRLSLAHPQLPKWKNLAKRFDSHDYMDGLPPTGWLRVARELIIIKSAMA